jgi:hypothetical protein
MLIKARFRISDVFFGMLLTVAIFAVGVIVGSSGHQPTNEPAAATAQQIQTSHKPHPFRWNWLTHDGTVFFTATLTFIAGIQAALFIWQLLSIQRTIKPAEDAARAAVTQSEAIIRAERAYVKISHRSPGLSIGPAPNQISLGLEATNHGRTPARIANFVMKIGHRPANRAPPERPPYDPIDPTRVEAFLVANESFNYSPTFVLPDGVLEEIRNAKRRLYLFGYVDYIDQFSCRHRGGYARVYKPETQYATGNLFFVTQAGYNYDRPRRTGEGDDWDEAT